MHPQKKDASSPELSKTITNIFTVIQQITPMKISSLKSTHKPFHGKENSKPSGIAPVNSPRPAKPPKPFKGTPRKEPLGVNSQNFPQMEVCSPKSPLVARELLQANRVPLPTHKATAEQPSNVQEWIMQQRRSRFNSGNNRNVSSTTKELFPATNEIMQHNVHDFAPIQNENLNLTSIDIPIPSTKMFQSDYSHDANYIPPPPNFSSGCSSYPVFTAAAADGNNSPGYFAQQTISIPPKEPPVAQIPPVPRPRTSLSAPSSPRKTSPPDSASGSMSYEDLSIVVNNLADAVKYPSASSLTVIDSQVQSEACGGESNSELNGKAGLKVCPLLPIYWCTNEKFLKLKAQSHNSK